MQGRLHEVLGVGVAAGQEVRRPQQRRSAREHELLEALLVSGRHVASRPTGGRPASRTTPDTETPHQPAGREDSAAVRRRRPLHPARPRQDLVVDLRVERRSARSTSPGLHVDGHDARGPRTVLPCAGRPRESRRATRAARRHDEPSASGTSSSTTGAGEAPNGPAPTTTGSGWLLDSPSSSVSRKAATRAPSGEMKTGPWVAGVTWTGGLASAPSAPIDADALRHAAAPGRRARSKPGWSRPQSSCWCPCGRTPSRCRTPGPRPPDRVRLAAAALRRAVGSAARPRTTACRRPTAWSSATSPCSVSTRTAPHLTCDRVVARPGRRSGSSLGDAAVRALGLPAEPVRQLGPVGRQSQAAVSREAALPVRSGEVQERVLAGRGDSDQPPRSRRRSSPR